MHAAATFLEGPPVSVEEESYGALLGETGVFSGGLSLQEIQRCNINNHRHTKHTGDSEKSSGGTPSSLLSDVSLLSCVVPPSTPSISTPLPTTQTSSSVTPWWTPFLPTWDATSGKGALSAAGKQFWDWAFSGKKKLKSPEELLAFLVTLHSLGDLGGGV